MSDFNIEIEAQLQQEALTRSVNKALQDVNRFTRAGAREVDNFVNDANRSFRRINAGRGFDQITDAAKDLRDILDDLNANIAVKIASGGQRALASTATAAVAGGAVAGGAATAAASPRKAAASPVEAASRETASAVREIADASDDATKSINKQVVSAEQLVQAYAQSAKAIDAAKEELKRLNSIQRTSVEHAKEVDDAMGKQQAALSKAQQEARLLGDVLSGKVALGSEEAAAALEKVAKAGTPKRINDVAKGFENVAQDADKAASSTKRYGSILPGTEAAVQRLDDAVSDMGRSLLSSGDDADTSGGKIAKFKTSIAGTAKALTPIVAAAAAAGTAALAYGTVLGQNIITQKRFADSIGVNVNELRVLEATFLRLGTPVETTRDILKQLSERSADAALNGGAVGEAFTILGIDMVKFASLTPDKQLLKLRDALSNVEDASLRTFLAIETGLEGFIDTGDAINVTTGELDKLKKSTEELVFPIEQEHVDLLKRVADWLVVAALKMEKMATSILAKVQPSIDKLEGTFQDMFDTLGTDETMSTFVSVLDAMADVGVAVLKTFTLIAAAANVLIKSVEYLTKILIAALLSLTSDLEFEDFAESIKEAGKGLEDAAIGLGKASVDLIIWDKPKLKKDAEDAGKESAEAAAAAAAKAAKAAPKITLEEAKKRLDAAKESPEAAAGKESEKAVKAKKKAADQAAAAEAKSRAAVEKTLLKLRDQRRAIRATGEEYARVQSGATLDAVFAGSKQEENILAGTAALSPEQQAFDRQQEAIDKTKEQLAKEQAANDKLIAEQEKLTSATKDLTTSINSLSTSGVTIVTKGVDA